MLLFVYGDDALRVREFAEDLVEKFIQKYDPARMNLDQFSFGKSDDETVWQAAQAAPFLAEKRFVAIRDAISMKKESAERWVEMMKRLPSSTVLMLTEDVAVTSFEKAQLVKLLQKEGIETKSYPITSLSGSDRIGWISARVQALGGSIVPVVAQLLIARTGDDSQLLDQEIRKLVAYADGVPVAPEMIEKLTTGVQEADIFGFTDALSARTTSAAAEKFLHELEAGSDPFQLLSMLTRQTRLLAQADVLIRDGIKDQNGLGKALDVHPFVASKLLQAVRVFDGKKLEKLLEIAVKADADAKFGLHAEVACVRILGELAAARKA